MIGFRIPGDKEDCESKRSRKDPVAAGRSRLANGKTVADTNGTAEDFIRFLRSVDGRSPLRLNFV